MGATDGTVIVIILVVTQHYNIYRTEILFYHVDSYLIYLFSFKLPEIPRMLYLRKHRRHKMLSVLENFVR